MRKRKTVPAKPLTAKMPTSTLYKGDSYTIHPKNLRARYEEQLRKARAPAAAQMPKVQR